METKEDPRGGKEKTSQKKNKADSQLLLSTLSLNSVHLCWPSRYFSEADDGHRSFLGIEAPNNLLGSNLSQGYLFLSFLPGKEQLPLFPGISENRVLAGHSPM